MGIFDGILKPIVGVMRQPLESFIRLETADDDTTLVASDGSLISYLKVHGSRQIIGEEEYRNILNACVVKLGARFDRPGHALQIYFMRSPDRIHEELRGVLRPSQMAARNVGMEIDDIFDERGRHLAKYLASEEIYFVLWTRASGLTKTDMQREKAQAKERKWVKATAAQYPHAAITALRNRHKSYVGGMVVALSEMGLHSSELEVHDALRAVRTNLYQSGLNSRWRACLPGDRIPPRAPENRKDMSALLWPTLPKQITASSARMINDRVVEFGPYLWGGVDMVLAPMEPAPFPQLLNRLSEMRFPFRLSYLIEGGGAQGMAALGFAASLLAITNADNHLIKDSIEGLTELARSEPVVKFRMSLATWAPKGEMDVLEDRLSLLMQATESWGYCQVSQIAGDPLDCVMSSAMGIACASTAPPAIAPLYEVMKLVPWQRASSPFSEGAILFRTPDGRIWPYQTGTNVTTTWFDLIFAQPGGGKSVLMNTLNLGTCLTSGISNLPYVAVIDIGPSSAGLISLFRDALPPSRRHEAVSFRLQMTKDYAINPFDTKLGMRVPQASERSFLVELLSLLCTPAGHAEPYDGITQLASFVVDEMFRFRNDGEGNAEPRTYLPRVDAAVDQILMEHDIQLSPGAYWWDVVDILYDKGLTFEASLAQRNASPILPDAVTAARRPQIRNLLEETQIGSSSEGVIHAFERMITSAVREFPILATVTRFSLAENRVCALDLADVCPQGDETADRQTAIMYMLARHALVTRWWVNEEILKDIPDRYRPYHEAQMRDISETPKRLCYDEFHRTSGSKSVRSQIVRDVREGRKRGIQIILASQLLDDFSDDMVDLATGVWILGTAVSDRAVDASQQRFGLSDTARWIIRNRLTGPRSSGGPCLLVLGTTDGRYEQHLINTLGPIELWAFSTSAEDVAMRNRLYARLGAQQARRLLAANFPGGSARSEIRRRVADYADKGETVKASVSAVINEMVTDMIDSVQRAMLGADGDIADKKKKDGEGTDAPAPAPAKEAAKPEAAAEKATENTDATPAEGGADPGADLDAVVQGETGGGEDEGGNNPPPGA